MSRLQNFVFWLLVFFVALALLWLLNGILMPFVTGLVLAYLFDPLVDRLEERRVRRWIGSLLVLILVGLILAVVMLAILPLLYQQAQEFIANLPQYVHSLQQQTRQLVATVQNHIPGFEVPELVGAEDGEGSRQIPDLALPVLREVLAGGRAVISFLSLLVITPVVTFFLLRDWDRMVKKIDSYLPRKQADTIRSLAHEIDQILYSFLRGQSLVCLFLGIFYAVGLSLAGLNFSIIIGLGAGLLSFIPYIGSAVGLITSMGVALVQFSSPTQWAIILAIFLLGQFLEGNILSPKLLGDAIHLHPVWIILALLAFGSLFGFTGVLIAVPCAAIAGVLIRFSLQRYRHSRFFDPDKSKEG